jgi:hypothetical protein
MLSGRIEPAVSRILARITTASRHRAEEVADWLGIPLEEFSIWAVAYLERDLANTGELARVPQ